MFNSSQEENLDSPKRSRRADNVTDSAWERSRRKNDSFNRYPGHPIVAWGILFMVVGAIIAFISAINAPDLSSFPAGIIFSGGLFSLGSFLVLAGLLYRIANAVEALNND